jgi:hypothetical protein
MDAATALLDLEMMVDSEADPVLSDAVLARILESARRVDIGGNPVGNVATVSVWTAGTFYAVGAVVTPDPADGYYWTCTTPATSGATQPDWPTTSGDQPFSVSISDADVEWLYAGTVWSPTWDLNAAAAKGWQIKAGKVASRFDFTTDGQSFQRAQMLDHCRSMERSYRRKIAVV